MTCTETGTVRTVTYCGGLKFLLQTFLSVVLLNTMWQTLLTPHHQLLCVSRHAAIHHQGQKEGKKKKKPPTYILESNDIRTCGRIYAFL